MKRLDDFITEDLKIDTSNLKVQNFLSCGDLNGVRQLLKECFVVSNQPRIPVPLLSTGLDHKAIVDQCIVFLLSKKLYNNVLTYGYRLGNNTNVNPGLHCVAVNSNVRIIKSLPWQFFHEIVGTQNFILFIVNFTVFHCDGQNYTQILGNRLNMPNYPPVSCQKPNQKLRGRHDDIFSPIRVATFLYKNSFGFKYQALFPAQNEYVTLREEIFDQCPSRINKLMLSRIDAVLKKLLLNHNKKIKYMSILDNLCFKTKPSGLTSHLDARTPTNRVTRFAIILLEKLIPLEMFGSRRNKALIFKKVSILLRLPIKGSLNFHDLLDSLKLKDFCWLRPQDDHFAKHDFEKASNLMHCFISWLFKSLVPKIVSTFFYCTEVSSCVEIIYFRHDVWNSLTIPFLSSYLEQHMTENTICRNHASYILSDYGHNRVRIVPKKANGEFRVIAVPYKGVDEEEYLAFRDNARSIICPVQSILEYLRNRRRTHFKKLYSANQIVAHIRDFKERLLKKHGYLPKLYYLKFDVDSCYDSIPRKKVMEVVNMALENESGFFVRSQTFFNPATGVISIQNVVNGNRKPMDDEIYVDNVHTTFITKGDLTKVLEMELFKTALSFNGKCYLRKDGLFQGTSLSALLVDLVYDDLIEHYDIFHPRRGDDTAVLRLADDFLTISTSPSRIALLKELALEGFGEYNANVKRVKIIDSLSQPFLHSLSFCALNISFDNLEVWKSPETLNTPDVRMSSATRIYRRLLRLFEMRLSYGTTDLRINSDILTLRQVDHMTTNVATAFIQAFKGKKVVLEYFVRFFSWLTTSAMRSCNISPTDGVFRGQVCSTMAGCFLAVLSPSQARFTDVITFLKNDAGKYRSIKSNPLS